MTARLNDAQVALIAWLATDPGDFEATNPQALDAYRAEVEGWLAARGVTV